MSATSHLRCSDVNVETKKEASSEDEFERAEKEREDDLKERDAFSKRLIEKDKEKTRSIMSKTDKKVSYF